MPSHAKWGTTDFEKMANIMLNFRSKREANDALALNDRLKEKIQAVFEEQQAKIGNMTCVLKETICSYLSLNQALGKLYCSASFFMARTSISFSSLRQFISSSTQVMFPIFACCSSNTAWIFSLSLSLRAKASLASLFDLKFSMMLAIFSKSVVPHLA